MSTKPIKITALAAEPSRHFCNSPGCPFHIAADDPKVRGCGDWATLENGVTVSHRWVDGRLLCDLCAQAMQSQSAVAPIATGRMPALRTTDSRR